MTLGKKIFNFLGESTSFFQLLNYMFKNIKDNISNYDDGWDWQKFDAASAEYSGLINFEWDYSAFIFFLRAMNHEISANGVNEDCRTWPYTFVIERLWDTMTHEPKPRGSEPEDYTQWAKAKGYL